MKVFLFDVGRVLLQVSPVTPLLEHLPQYKDEEDFWQHWVTLESVRNFETGRISEADFIHQVVKELDTGLTSEEFMFYFDQWPRALNPGLDEIFQMVPAGITVATMSNMNKRHWQIVTEDFGLNRFVSLHFPSFETGFMKPDKEAYLAVAQKLGIEPGEITFFDDNLVNVKGAIAAGLKAIKTVGTGQLKKALVELLS